MGWLHSLLASLTGQAPPVPAIEHPVLGPIRPSYRPKARPWRWTSLQPLRHARGPVHVTWLGDALGPTEAQIAFWNWLKDSIDSLAEQAWPLLAEAVDDGRRLPWPGDPWDELAWTGASLPADGRHASEWSVSFAPRSRPHGTLTITFREGLPAFVTAAPPPARWIRRRSAASGYAAPGRRLPAPSARRRTTGRRTSGGCSAGRWDLVARAVQDPA